MENTISDGATPYILPEKLRDKYNKVEYILVNGRNLTDGQKLLASLIQILSVRPEGCTLTNKDFAIALEWTPKAVSTCVSRLVKKQIISIEFIDTSRGKLRVLRSLLQPLAATQVPQIADISPQAKDSPPHIEAPSPQNPSSEASSNCGPNIITRKEYHSLEKEKIDNTHVLSPQDEWFDVIPQKAKERIEKTKFDYKPIKDKETESIEKWKEYQNNENPSIILEYLSKLILIKDSERYKTKEFWASMPVNIASTFSYMDQIRNTYNALLIDSEIKPRRSKPKENKAYPNTLSKPTWSSGNKPVVNKKNHEPTWEGLMSWSNEKFKESTFENLRKVKYDFRGDSVYILEPIAESLERIIRKYFYQLMKEPIAVFFHESVEKMEEAA
ncbi:hypothetical protein AB3N59_20490 (plasmid) [Leptospira sp. WS92.C1]